LLISEEVVRGQARNAVGSRIVVGESPRGWIHFLAPSKCFEKIKFQPFFLILLSTIGLYIWDLAYISAGIKQDMRDILMVYITTLV
jgi:hypothetical protein